MAPRNTGSNRTLDILNSIAEQDFLGAEIVQNLREHGLRVEQIAIGLIRPDAAQPRRVLPETIHQAFHNEEITPLQALKQYIEKVRIIARQHGRPFENLLDLLMSGEDIDEASKLTPQEQDLRDLTNLALTLRQDGQVNPLTIVDRSYGSMPQYTIETGERRYWANYIHMELIPGYDGDNTVPCIILQPHQASVFRQAKENTSRAGLNAIGMARQAALLILAIYDIHPPAGAVSHEFYRQALELDLRSKREFTSEVLAAMGGISRVHFSRYKSLLYLADEALELADRHNLDEGRLRYVVQLPVEQHYEIVRQIVDFNLTMKQIWEMCEEPSAEDTRVAYAREAVQTVRVLQSRHSVEPEIVLQLLLEKENDIHIVRAKLQRHKQLIEDIERLLEG
jgi:hypothetical protein